MSIIPTDKMSLYFIIPSFTAKSLWLHTKHLLDICFLFFFKLTKHQSNKTLEFQFKSSKSSSEASWAKFSINLQAGPDLCPIRLMYFWPHKHCAAAKFLGR